MSLMFEYADELSLKKYHKEYADLNGKQRLVIRKLVDKNVKKAIAEVDAEHKKGWHKDHIRHRRAAKVGHIRKKHRR